MNDFLAHRKAFIEAGRPLKEKKKYYLPKVSEKRKKKLAEEKELIGVGDTEKQKFFKRCIKQMTGVCAETGEPTTTTIFKYAVRSICHLLSQQHCPSVAQHPLNWIELQQDFHVAFDAMSWEEREQLKCWPIIRDRLIMVYPDLAEEERRFFPESVLKFMNENNPFK